MYKSLIFLSLIISLSFRLSAQQVLDAPFISAKAMFYEPNPERFNWLHYHSSLMTDEEKNYIDKHHIYLHSYLYAEPEYVRVRVIRTIDIKSNPNWGNGVAHSYWFRDEERRWKMYSDTGKEYEISPPAYTGFDTHVPYWVQAYEGVNIMSIREDSSEFSEEKSNLSTFEPILNYYIDHGFAKINDAGVYEISKPFIPDKLEILSFQDLIIKFLLETEMTSAWTERDYRTPLTREDLSKILGADGKAVNITGIRVMEDYYIDQEHGKLTSYIIGLGIIGDGGRELCWVYYPSFRWELYEKCAIYDGKVTNYEHLLDYHLYANKIDSIWPIAGGHVPNDGAFMVELDALLAIEFRREENRLNGITPSGKHKGMDVEFGKSKIEYSREGVANGKVKVLYPNQQVRLTGEMVSGQCNGAFRYYYANGKIRAERNFTNGKLSGDQVNYWQNGTVYAKYKIANGQIQNLARWYDDGTLLEKGEFKNSIMHGVWTYRIKTPEEYMRIVEHYNLYDKLPVKPINGIVEYSVAYHHEISPSCLLAFGRICLKSKVLK